MGVRRHPASAFLSVLGTGEGGVGPETRGNPQDAAPTLQDPSSDP